MNINPWQQQVKQSHAQTLPGKILMSMTVRVCVWMFTMTSTPNSAMPSSARSCRTSATMASLLGGGNLGMASSSCREKTVDIRMHNL